MPDNKPKYNVLKASFWYTIGTVISRGASFFVLPLFTSLMTTYDYGVYGVYTSYLGILEVFVLFGLSSTVQIAESSKDIDADSYIATCVIIPVLLSVIIAVIINLLLLKIPEMGGLSPLLWNFMIITSCAVSIFNIVNAKLIFEGKYILNVVFSFISTFSGIFLSVILAVTVFRSNTYIARVSGIALPAVLIAIVCIARFIPWKKIEKQSFVLALTFGLPMLFHTASTVILTNSDRIIIKAMGEFSSVGIYSVAVTLATIPTIIATSLSSAWTPWFYHNMDKKDYDVICSLIDKFIYGFTYIIVCFLLIIPELVHFFTNKAYWECIYSFIPLSLCALFEFLYSFAVSVEYYFKKTWLITVGTVICTVTNIFLDILFIKLWGYVGAAYATVLSKMFLYGIHYVFSKRLTNKRIMKLSSMAISIFFCVLIAFLTEIFSSVWYIRYLIIVIYTVVFIKWLTVNKSVMMKIMSIDK